MGSALSASPPMRRTERASLAGLIFVVVLLLALISLPPLASGHAEALRTHLDSDVEGFGAALTATENSMQEMQAATRGYLLTETTTFLEQYRAAQADLPNHLQDLTQRAPAVDPALAAQTEDLIQIISRWQAEGGDRQITLVQQGRVNDALAEVAAGKSQALFESFRQRINDLQAQTRRAEDDLVAQINAARSLQTAMTSGLGVLGLLAVGFVLFSFRSMVALMRDLHVERERAAQLARDARTERQRLQTVFDSSPEGLIVAHAPDGRMSLINPAATALLGPIDSQQSLDQQPWTSRVYRPGGEPYPFAQLPLVRAVAHGEACRAVEVVIEQPDGQRVPVLLTSVPLPAEQRDSLGAIAVFQDLRALREVERLKSDFVALVSHELRTPLTAIQGSVYTLLNGRTDDAQRTRDLLQIIHEQSDRLQELIDNLLSLSQVEAGAFRLRRGMVALPPLIQGVLRQFRERADAVRVQADLAPQLPLVSADEHRIEQVLFNLLDNARKFSPTDGMITISARPADSMVAITVRDQGPGIPLAARERIFERFYQLEQPHTRNVGGSGLGLAICKAIVEAHGGTIRVDDAPGGGAQFTVTLPALPVDETTTPGAPQLLQRPQSARAHVLVVDDDPALRRLLETSLPDAGYQVQSVSEAQAALEVVIQQPPDIVLLDVMLPGTDGFAVCQQLREWTKVPIVMLTARAAEKDVVLGLQVGADDYVTKPFRPAELVARMEAVLRRAHTDAPAEGLSLIQIGDLAIDLAGREVTLAGESIDLTPLEYHILVYLARHAGQVLTHQQILDEVWGDGYQGENQYLWVHIAHLRQKLEADSKQPRYILTERGVGYRMAKA